MSQREFTSTTSTTSAAVEKPRVVESTEDPVEKSSPCVSNECSGPDRSTRDRVIKEVGLTSTAFIGPAFPPETPAVKSDIEDSLSEFYRELEKIDAVDCANGNPGNQDFVRPLVSPEPPTGNKTQDVLEEKTVNTRTSAETDGYHESGGRKQASWPHWYQNAPYYPRKQRPDPAEPSPGGAVSNQNQWHYSQPLNPPPNPRFHQPPFPPRPPPSAFPNPQNQPPHVNPPWTSSDMVNQYQDELHYPAFSSFPPLDVSTRSSRGFHGGSPRHFGRSEQGCSYDADNESVRWSGDRKEEWSRYNEEYDQRLGPENDPWEQQHQYDDTYPSALVLILMRGLPGSGKSTMARELLSTGPTGIILSTDDYFAHRDEYRYDPGLLGAAHDWNQSRAKDALHDGRSPVIIDNTNIQAWEMKPYVKMALETGYRVDFCEPDTSWKFDPYELEKRNKHGVPQEKIAQMMDRFSFPVSIDIVMRSQEPHHVNQRRRAERPHTNQQHFH